MRQLALTCNLGRNKMRNNTPPPLPISMMSSRAIQNAVFSLKWGRGEGGGSDFLFVLTEIVASVLHDHSRDLPLLPRAHTKNVLFCSSLTPPTSPNKYCWSQHVSIFSTGKSGRFLTVEIVSSTLGQICRDVLMNGVKLLYNRSD